MRIVFFVGSLKFGGAERVVTRLANQLCNEREVHIIIYENQIAYSVDPRVTIHNISPDKKGVVGFIRVFARLTRLLHRLKPHYAIAPSRLSSVILAWTLYPRVITRFDIYPFAVKRKSRRFMTLLSHNLPNVKYVVCPSEELRQDVTPWIIGSKRLVTIHNPIDRQNTEEGLDERQKERYVVCVGRLRKQKHIDMVLRAFAASSISKTHGLKILGDGPQLASLRLLASQFGITDRVEFLGFRKDAAFFIKGAEFLVSASSGEGFPNTLIEALSLGTPVVSSDCKTGPKEIVLHGKNGYLFPVGDQKALINCLETIVGNPDLRGKMRIEAKESVQRFKMENILSAWAEILKY